MIKACSLDFLNNETFEADIKTADGRVLCSASEAVTPEKLLILYFKDIYVENPLPREKSNLKEEPIEDVLSEKAIKDVAAVLETELQHATEAVIKEEPVESLSTKEKPTESGGELLVSATKKSPSGSVSEESDVPYDDSNDPIKFDEEQAQRVSDYCAKMGEFLMFPSAKLEELKQAAYYHNIGATKFLNKDKKQKGFNKLQASAGCNILLNEKGMPQQIASAVKSWADNYDISNFKLTEEIPYADIIALANYYDNLIIFKNNTKEDALAKMLQHGGNKFNIFVLHKFIKMMRDSNE